MPQNFLEIVTVPDFASNKLNRKKSTLKKVKLWCSPPKKVLITPKKVPDMKTFLKYRYVCLRPFSDLNVFVRN